jgi:putative flippase GtrA
MQLIRFLLVGFVNTAVGFCFIIAAMEILKLDCRLANAAGYAVGCLTNFFLNRTWTFRFSGAWWSSAARWLVVVGICYCLNLITVIFMREVLHVEALFAQVGGVLVYTAASFARGKLFAFRDNRPFETGQLL